MLPPTIGALYYASGQRFDCTHAAIASSAVLKCECSRWACDEPKLPGMLFNSVRFRVSGIGVLDENPFEF